MITAKDGTPLTQAIREALDELDETQRDRISRADSWRLVKRAGRWVIVLPRRRGRRLRRVKKVCKV